MGPNAKQRKEVGGEPVQEVRVRVEGRGGLSEGLPEVQEPLLERTEETKGGDEVTAKDLVFNAGVPTAPDVAKLDAKWPEMNEGDKISKADVATVIAEPVESHRFKTVVDAWRRKLYRERNIYLGAVSGYGWKVLDRRERCEAGGHKLKVGLRATKRGGALVVATDRTGLPAEVCRAADHVVALSAMVTTMAAAEAKKLRYPDPVLKLKA